MASLPPSAAWEAKRLLQLLLSQTLDFQFLQEEWQLRSTAGTPQGGSHSAGLFARTLDYFLANLVTKWERLGYRAPFDPLWLLLYVDDIMLCFKNWRQACALMPSFLDMLNSIGMKVNFSKSCVIVDAVLLRAAATECTSPLLREFQWSETTSYLNRPFGYQVSVETLCQQVAQKVHAAWGSLRGILGRRWWTNPSQTDTLLTKHVGSVFLWLSPVLYPYSAVLNSIQTLQTTVFADALGLFIPDLSYDTAVQLVRLRRHVVKRWLLHVAPAGNWCAKLLRRLWTFTGHICRQTSHPSQPARVMMGLFASTHAHGLARPGPWKTLHALFHKFWTSHELEGDFLNTALDRESWKTLEPAFVQWFQPSTRCNVEFLQCSPWESPDMLLRAHVPWVHTIVVQLTNVADNRWRLAVTWLDEMDGMCSWSHFSDQNSKLTTFTSGMACCLRYLAMIYQPFVIQIAFATASDWALVFANSEAVNSVFKHCPCGSWVQLFPLSKKELRHRTLSHSLTILAP